MPFAGNYTPAVKRALEELERAFPGTTVTAQEDGEGGANVVLDLVEVGPPFEQETSWIGFRIGFQYPYSDIYPHFVRSDLKRLDGKALGPGMSQGTFLGRPGIQVSRRSNNLSSAQTAVLKLLKVLEWLKTRP